MLLFLRTNKKTVLLHTTKYYSALQITTKNYSVLQQAERLKHARQAAASGSLSSYSIPLLADTQTLHNKSKIHWSLKFPLPAPSSGVPVGSPPFLTKSARVANKHWKVQYGMQCPSPTLIPPALSFLILLFLLCPDPASQHGPVRQQKLGFVVHRDIANWLSTNLRQG